MESLAQLRRALQQALTPVRMQELLQRLFEHYPDESLPILLELLKQDDTTVQVQVIALLPEHFAQHPDLVRSCLMACFELSPAWDVRQAAAQALGRIEDDSIISRLEALLKSEDWDLVAHAVQTLGQIGSPACLPALTQAADHANPFVRKRAAEALSRFPWSPAVEKPLLALLQNSPEQISVRLLETLQESASWRARQALLQLMTSLPERKEQLQTAMSKIELNFQALLKSAEPLSAYALEALSEWVSTAPPEERERISQHMVEALRQSMRYSPEDREHLCHLLLRQFPLLSATLQDLLLFRLLEGERPLPPELPSEAATEISQRLLVPAIEGVELTHQARALELLVACGNAEQLPHLIPVLLQPGPLWETTWPLWRQAPGLSVQLLARLYRQQPDREVRTRIITLLSALQAPSTTAPLLVRLLREESQADLRQSLVTALGELGEAIVPLLLPEIARPTDRQFLREALKLLLDQPVPPDSPAYLRLLAHGDDEVRELATELLGHVSGLLPELLAYLCQPSHPAPLRDQVRTLILERPGVLGDILNLLPTLTEAPDPLPLQYLLTALLRAHPDQAPLLRPWLSFSHQGLRRCVVEALIAAEIVAPVALLLEVLNDPLPQMQQQALYSLVSQGSAVIPQVLETVEAEPELLTAAVRIFTAFEAKQLTPYLTNAGPQGQLALIQALAERGHPEQEGPLLLALVATPSPLHQAAALAALQQLAPSALAPQLVNLLPDLPLALQCQAMGVLGAMGNPDSIAPLRQILVNHSPPEQASAALALADLNAGDAIPDLLHLLPIAPLFLQEALITALGQLQAEAARPALLALLQQPESGLQEASARALASIPGPDSLAGLIQALGQTEDPALQVTLVQAIGQRGGSESLEQLKIHWLRWSLPVQRSALRVMGSSEETWVLPLLAEILAGENWHLSLTALEVLGAIPSAEAVELVRNCLQRYQDEHSVKGWILRSAARESLDRLRSYPLSEI
jgi:HEAT repeat protein